VHPKSLIPVLLSIRGSDMLSPRTAFAGAQGHQELGRAVGGKDPRESPPGLRQDVPGPLVPPSSCSLEQKCNWTMGPGERCQGRKTGLASVH
jgi:hypothetical protein